MILSWYYFLDINEHHQLDTDPWLILFFVMHNKPLVCLLLVYIPLSLFPLAHSNPGYTCKSLKYRYHKHNPCLSFPPFLKAIIGAEFHLRADKVLSLPSFSPFLPLWISVSEDVRPGNHLATDKYPWGICVLLKSARRASESSPLCPPIHPALYNNFSHGIWPSLHSRFGWVLATAVMGPFMYFPWLTKATQPLGLTIQGHKYDFFFFKP